MIKHSLIIAMLLIYGCSETRPIDPIKTGREGDTIPNFTILLADGLSYFKTADLPKGKINVLFYFSPVCPHCRVQMRTIVNNIDKLDGLQFTVLTIANYAYSKHFYDRYKLEKHPNIIFGIDTGYVFPIYFKTESVPFLAVYNEQGKLNSVYQGTLGFSQLKMLAHDNVIAQSQKP